MIEITKNYDSGVQSCFVIRRQSFSASFWLAENSVDLINHGCWLVDSMRAW